MAAAIPIASEGSVVVVDSAVSSTRLPFVAVALAPPGWRLRGKRWSGREVPEQLLRRDARGAADRARGRSFCAQGHDEIGCLRIGFLDALVAPIPVNLDAEVVFNARFYLWPRSVGVSRSSHSRRGSA